MPVAVTITGAGNSTPRTEIAVPATVQVVLPPPTISTTSGSTGVMATSISYQGASLFFDKPYPTGVWPDGTPWAIPNAGDAGVTVVSEFPARSGSAGITWRNGVMINPSGQTHGYDGRAAGYVAGAAGANPTLPYLWKVNESYVKATSRSSAAGSGANTTYIDKHAVFTCPDHTPSTDEFRPPYFGSVKPIFRPSNINYSKLPQRTTVAGRPSLVNIADRFSQPQVDHCYATSPAGRPNALQSFHKFGDNTTSHVYGENIALDNCEAILGTYHNDSVALKTPAVMALIQAGIDWYGVALTLKVADGGGGGHQGGRKIVVAYAGWLLGHAGMQAVAAETTGAGFGESLQFVWSSVALGGGVHGTGWPVGGPLFGYTNAFGKPFPYAGSGAKDIRDPLGYVDGGLTTQSPLGVKPANASASYVGGLYVDIASTHALLVETIVKIPEVDNGDSTLRTTFNNETEIRYADRLWNFGLCSNPDGSSVGRDLGALTRSLHGTKSGGALIAAGYGSPYGNNMRAGLPSEWTG